MRSQFALTTLVLVACASPRGTGYAEPGPLSAHASPPIAPAHLPFAGGRPQPSLPPGSRREVPPSVGPTGTVHPAAPPDASTAPRAPPPSSTCQHDRECVRAACCHASECVPIARAPACEDVVCTLECRPGTLDCGAGRCVCMGGVCAVQWVVTPAPAPPGGAPR